MSKNVTKLISPRVLCTSITNRVPSWCDRFYGLLELYVQKCHKNSYLREFCVQVAQIVFLADLTVLRLITTVWEKMLQNSYLRKFCALMSQIVFLADLTVLRHITTVWAETSKNSYLLEFFAQVSKIVFLADLTVLQLVRKLWEKLSQNSYFREFCAQVSKIVFLADLIVLRLIKTVMSKNVTKLVSPRILCTSITNRVLKLIWLFFGLLQLYEQKCYKTHITTSFVHKCNKLCP